MESLLEYESASARFLERPAAAVAADAASVTSMIGRQIGPYTIVAPLGAGGMGEVYRARDSKLGRDVAIKILPAHFTADPERRARFAREARMLATLNHPHIGAIYGLEEVDGVSALVLELVEGQTLADRLERGPLPLAEALAIARQIAEALEAAHEKGHRPSRPEAGQHRPARRARPVSSTTCARRCSTSAWRSRWRWMSRRDRRKRHRGSFDGTADGRILGTPAYMSPEQARGLAVDKRTDIWAFGCVLYEMLRAAARSRAPPSPTHWPASSITSPTGTPCRTDTPVPIRKLLERCLRKDPKKRLHDIADALIELEDSSLAPGSSADTGTGSARRVAQHRRRERLAWIVAAASLAIASGAVALRRQEAPPLVSPIEFDIAPPENWYQGARVAQLRNLARQSAHHGCRADAGRTESLDSKSCRGRHGAHFRALMVRVLLSGRPTASRLDSSRAASSSPFAMAVVRR